MRARRLSAARPPSAERKVILIATGSEVEIALDVAEQLEAQGIGADVVSMPCTERFDAQDAGLSRGHPARRLEPRDPARVDRGRDDLRLGALHRACTACASASTASAPRPRRTRPLRAFRAHRPTRSPRGCSTICKKGKSHDEGCNQRFRPHRPAGRARDPRAARLRARAGRDQRPRRRQVQRLAVQARQRPRRVPGRGQRRRQRSDRQRQAHPGHRRARPGQAAARGELASTSRSNAPASSPTAKAGRSISTPAPSAC